MGKPAANFTVVYDIHAMLHFLLAKAKRKRGRTEEKSVPRLYPKGATEAQVIAGALQAVGHSYIFEPKGEHVELEVLLHKVIFEFDEDGDLIRMDRKDD